MILQVSNDENHWHEICKEPSKARSRLWQRLREGRKKAEDGRAHPWEDGVSLADVERVKTLQPQEA